jgi:peptidoglycan/xylan/chitin deacetylase (PgdA/CDA1 family)
MVVPRRGGMALAIKHGLLRLSEAVGALKAADLFAWRSPRILMYHRFARHSLGRRVGADDLEVQAKLLRDNRFNVVSVKDLCARIEEGRPIMPKTVAITVDDGYEDFYTWAYPVFAKYALPVTVYITTDFIDQRTWLWPDTIEYILETSGRRHLTVQLGDEQKEFDLQTVPQRRLAWSSIGSHCLSVSNNEREVVIKRLAEHLQVKIPDVPVREYGAMRWHQLREMSRNGIDVGGHTRTHPVLTSINSSQADAEIRGSKVQIEHQLDQSADSFAYPNGTRSDYNEAVKALVRAAGYKNAMVAFADASVTDDLFELRRYPIGANEQRFKSVIYGVEYLSMCMRGRE